MGKLVLIRVDSALNRQHVCGSESHYTTLMRAVIRRGHLPSGSKGYLYLECNQGV